MCSYINILKIPNNLYILNGQFYILEFCPLVKIFLKYKWIHFVYLVLKYGEFTHITLIFCSKVGIMSGILTGRRVLSFSQGSFKICKNSIFDLASFIPSWKTKFVINTVVGRHVSCSDNAANVSTAIPKLDPCMQLHIKQIFHRQIKHWLIWYQLTPCHTKMSNSSWFCVTCVQLSKIQRQQLSYIQEQMKDHTREWSGSTTQEKKKIHAIYTQKL